MKETGKVRMIRTDAKTRTSDTVRNGPKPCQLGLVDGEMRAGGTVQTLLVQDPHRRGCRERFGLHASGSCT